MIWLVVGAVLMAAAVATGTPAEVFLKVFQASLLEAHDWGTLDFSDMSSDQRYNSSDAAFLTCGRHADHPQRVQELSSVFGERHVRFASVDHLEGSACFLVYGRQEAMNALSRSDWPHHIIPPALKVHHSVLALLDKDHSVQPKRDSLLGSSLGIPDTDMLVIKFAATMESTSEMETTLRQAESTWLQREGFAAAGPASEFQMGHMAALRSLGSGSWARMLTRLSTAAGQESCALSLNEIASDIVFYKEYVELRHIDVYLQSGGDAAKHCLAQLVHRISSDHRVLSITGQSTPRLLNYLARGICQSGDPSESPLTDVGLTGEGEIVGVADSGLNDNSCFFWDGGSAYSTEKVPRRSIGSSYVEGERRKVIQYISYADGLDEIGGHGTHVCGTIVGKSLNPDYVMANGIAPEAKIAFVDVQRNDIPYLSIPDLETQLLRTLYNAGARVFSNSWGGYASSYYSERGSDADSFLYQNPDSLLLFAAGNAGADGFDTLYSPCDSKNVLCVGSSDSRDDSSDESGISSRISHFSSMGPTFDGRIKPDVLGPGFSVVSAMSGGDSAMQCGAIDMFGTSMATPAVAGAALLVREYFKKKYGSVCRAEYEDCVNFEPSGVLTKAILVHSAFGLSSYSSPDFDSRTEESHFSLGSTPDEFQGFGQVAVGNILALTSAAAAKKDLYVKDMFWVKSSTAYDLKVNVDSFEVPFRVTIVWYDPPSSVGSSGSLLINDLDLEVISPDGKTFLGNGMYDKKNTIEQVTIRRQDWEDTGEYTVRVIAGKLANNNPQYMALVITCNGQVTKQLNVASTQKLDELSRTRAGNSQSSSSLVKSVGGETTDAVESGKILAVDSYNMDSGDVYHVEPNFDANVAIKSVHESISLNVPDTKDRSSHGSWRHIREVPLYSNGNASLMNYWTSEKYEVDVDVVLESLQSACFDPIDITDDSLRLFSVRMVMSGQYISGNDAFVGGVVIAAPNGEKVQVGGYHTYAATSRIWARSWPVSWTGLKKGALSQFDGTRIVNMAPMGKDVTGKWSVCLQLLHSGWSSVHYSGKIYLAFDEIPLEDVSTPATVKGQLKADANIIVVSAACTTVVVLALLALVKNREAIYLKLTTGRYDKVDDSSVSSVRSADPRPMLSCIYGEDDEDDQNISISNSTFLKSLTFGMLSSGPNSGSGLITNRAVPTNDINDIENVTGAPPQNPLHQGKISGEVISDAQETPPAAKKYHRRQ